MALPYDNYIQNEMRTNIGVRMTRTESIKALLLARTHSDLADRYSFNMECQVNVGRHNGTQVNRVSADGKHRWTAWTDPDQMQEWKNFRIPRNADSEPEFIDSEMKFDLTKYAKAIGMTGWDWYNRQSIYFAFDFDSIVGHRAGLTAIELQEVRDVAVKIPWVTVRKSTSGHGFHFYIDLEEPFPTMNHTEHAAVARAILSKMTSETGYAFDAKVDVCGHNMWIWHEKMKDTDGLTVVKQGVAFPPSRIPSNWREHIDVVSGKRLKITPRRADGMMVKELSSKKTLVGLDEMHLKIIAGLEDTGSYWDADNHLLVTHTYGLKRVHTELGLKGIFDTNATGKEMPNDINCFCFPLPAGALAVYRFQPGIQEHKSWQQDGRGWTCCYFNRHPDLETISRSYDAVENEKGWFIFGQSSVAAEALVNIGVTLGVPMQERKTSVREHPDGQRLILKVQRDAVHDDGQIMKDWEACKDGTWTRIVNAPKKAVKENTIIANFDDVVRHLISTDGQDLGWVLKDNNSNWNFEPMANARLYFKHKGKKDNDIEQILGAAVINPWRVICQPFKDEYPGGRNWNRKAPQFTCKLLAPDQELLFPTWEKVLQHLGNNLDQAVLADSWCMDNGVITGAQYLTLWVASMFQYPNQPTPYLFFYGDQSTGKSLFHEMLNTLMTKGYVRADEAMRNRSGFNGELEGAVLCVIEETHLGRDKQAYSHLKDWVTSIMLPIHEKGKTPINIMNTTHWCQFSNEQDACPVFTGDRRITYIFVGHLEEQIPKKIMLQRLREEAPAFLTHVVMRIVIPETNDRLNIPPLTTQDKEDVARANESALEMFIRDKLHYVEGKAIPASDFIARFTDWVRRKDPNEAIQWANAQKIAKELPMAVSTIFKRNFIKGRLGKERNWHYGNIWWENVTPTTPYVISGETLVQITTMEHNGEIK